MGDTAVTAWLDSVTGHAQALLLDGPAGIGKTHRWDAAIELASARGFRVLRAQPAFAEVRLVGSALTDLCAGIGDDEIARLPPLQAVALSTALLRSAGDSAPINPQAVALAFTGLLRLFAAAGPVLVCVDDIQWLDAQTAAVLGFAARRLPNGTGLLLALRTEPGVPDPQLVGEVAGAVQLHRHTVAPMDEGALAGVVRDRLGSTVPASVLRSVIESSGGNPLFGVEIARTLLLRGRLAPVGRVPVPSSLGELVVRHLTDLPQPTRVGLAAASALRRPSLRQLRELGVADDLPAAEHAGLIRIDGHEVVFTHPIYAAAAYDVLVASERMTLHRRLAAVVEGTEERARHLALGADEPDEDVAAALDLARSGALRRGAVQAALDSCELAVRATPPGSPALVERLTVLGGLLFRVGETARAKAVLGDALAAAVDPLPRARALHALGRVVNDTEGSVESIPLELEALDLAGDDMALQADIRMGLAISYAHDWDVALFHAHVACALLDADPHADPMKVAAALSARVGAAFYAGVGADLDSCRRAVALEEGDVGLPVSDRALAVLFYLQLWTDDFSAAREQMRQALELAEGEGDEASRCYILINMASLEVRAGRWDLAQGHLDECLETSIRAEIELYARAVHDVELLVGAWRGELDAATERANGLVQAGHELGNGIVEQRGLGLRGICALLRGDAVAAAADLDRYMSLFELAHAREPALWMYAGERVEALVGAGRLDDAETALGGLFDAGERLGRTAVLASASRAQAMLAAERGDADAAIAAAERSVQLYDRIERRFDRARALLTKGQVHRRFKQKSLARRELSAALAEFEALAATPFVERALAELSRIGLRPAASLGLTNTEQQIADLTATGLTSAEIAARLFLSTKTVSSNLTRIYRKLGVRNRAELTASLTARKG